MTRRLLLLGVIVGTLLGVAETGEAYDILEVWPVSGTFAVGERIRGATSGAEAKLAEIGLDGFHLVDGVGSFQENEEVVGLTSSAVGRTAWHYRLLDITRDPCPTVSNDCYIGQPVSFHVVSHPFPAGDTRFTERRVRIWLETEHPDTDQWKFDVGAGAGTVQQGCDAPAAGTSGRCAIDWTLPAAGGDQHLTLVVTRLASTTWDFDRLLVAAHDSQLVTGTYWAHVGLVLRYQGGTSDAEFIRYGPPPAQALRVEALPADLSLNYPEIRTVSIDVYNDSDQAQNVARVEATANDFLSDWSRAHWTASNPQPSGSVFEGSFMPRIIGMNLPAGTMLPPHGRLRTSFDVSIVKDGRFETIPFQIRADGTGITSNHLSYPVRVGTLIGSLTLLAVNDSATIPAQVQPGDTLHYRIEWLNKTSGEADDLTVVVLPPLDAAFLPATATGGASIAPDGSLLWPPSATPLPSDATWSAEFDLQVASPLSAGFSLLRIVSRAHASVHGTTHDAETMSEKAANAAPYVRTVAYKIPADGGPRQLATKVDPGAEMEWEIVVTNPSVTTLTIDRAHADLPTSSATQPSSLVPAGSVALDTGVVWNGPYELAPEASTTFLFRSTVRNPVPAGVETLHLGQNGVNFTLSGSSGIRMSNDPVVQVNPQRLSLVFGWDNMPATGETDTNCLAGQVEVVDGAGQPLSGQTVSVSTTMGGLVPEGSSAVPQHVVTVTTDAVGRAGVRLYSTTTVGTASVVASYETFTAEATIQMLAWSLDLSVTRDRLPATGELTSNSSTVSIRLVDSLGFALDGRTVALSTTAGTLSGAGETQVALTTDASGLATAELYSQLEPADATLQATFRDRLAEGTVTMVRPFVNVVAKTSTYTSVPVGPPPRRVSVTRDAPADGSDPEITPYGVTETLYRVTLECEGIAPADLEGRQIRIRSQDTFSYPGVRFCPAEGCDVTTDTTIDLTLDGEASAQFRLYTTFDEPPPWAAVVLFAESLPDAVHYAMAAASIANPAERLAAWLETQLGTAPMRGASWLLDVREQIGDDLFYAIWAANNGEANGPANDAVAAALYRLDEKSGGHLADPYREHSQEAYQDRMLKALAALQRDETTSSPRWLLNGLDFTPLTITNDLGFSVGIFEPSLPSGVSEFYELVALYPADSSNADEPWRSTDARLLDGWIHQRVDGFTWSQWSSAVGLGAGAPLFSYNTGYYEPGYYPSNGHEYPTVAELGGPPAVSVNAPANAVIVDCPVYLTVTDALGRVTGFDPRPGDRGIHVAGEIPGVHWFAARLSDGTLGWTLGLPDQPLRLTLRAYDAGSVTMTLLLGSWGRTVTFAAVPLASADVATLVLDPGSAVPPVLDFADGRQATGTIGVAYKPAVYPSVGPPAGGTRVIVTGIEAASGAIVTFGGQAATDVSAVDGATLAATTPPGTGNVDVVVTIPGHEAVTLTAAFSYEAGTDPRPTVTGIVPASGPTTGGTPVTITGTGFAAGATVTLGGVAAAVQSIATTAIHATTGAHAAGPADIVVTNSDQQAGVLAGGFTYTEAPPPSASRLRKQTPADGAAGLPPTLGVYWLSGLREAGYWVCWDTTDNAACDTRWWPSADTLEVLSSLAPGTYYWQVRAQTKAGWVEADEGAWWTLTVGGTPPAPAVRKATPADAETLEGRVPLRWESTLPGVGYAFCWDTTDNERCDTRWWPAGASTAKWLNGLAPGDYYWQVRARWREGTVDADGGAWWHFTVAGEPPAAPGPFAKTSPAAGSAVTGGAVTLRWGASARATSYEYCLDTTDDDGCEGPWRSAAGRTSAALTGLAADTYYWHVRAWNSQGTREASDAWWPVTVTEAPSGTVTKQSPPSDATGLAASVRLQWSGTVADPAYWVCWDTTDDDACDTAWRPNGGSASRLLSYLAPGTYYWQVRAKTPNGWVEADQSTWFVFTVGNQ